MTPTDVAFLSPTISAILTATYANAVYDAFPEVNNRLRESCQLNMLSGHLGTPNGVIHVIGMPKKPKHELTSLLQKDVAFVEPMECLAVSKPPDAAQWIWEIKIDGYRAIAVKSDDNVNLYSGPVNLSTDNFPTL